MIASKQLAAITLLLLSAQAIAAPAVAAAEVLPTAGALIVVPASGEVRHTNDQAVLTLSIEEVDRDKSVAASRVNQKMKQGLELIKQQDPQASLKTQNYHTYPVYAEVTPAMAGQTKAPRVSTSWRVGQSLQVTTTNLAALPQTVAAAQRVLALNGLRFGLAPATARQLDEQRIAATYANFTDRLNAIAHAMGRKLSDATVDTVDFEGSGNYLDKVAVSGSRLMSGMVASAAPAPVEEPSFEPGETTLQMRLVGKVRFK